MGRFLSRVEFIFETVMAIMTGLLVVIACYQITARYLLGTGLTWTEETMRYVFVATVMLGIYFMTKNEGFATLTIFSDFVAKKSKTGDAVLKLLRYLIQIIFYFTLCYYGAKVCVMAIGRVSTATQTSFALIYLPMPLGGFLGGVNIILRCLRDYGILAKKGGI